MNPPSKLTMHNGETLYVVGHQYTHKAVRSGSWNNPRIWEGGVVPQYGDNVWVPDGVLVLIHSEWECTNLVVSGAIEFLYGAQGTVSTITGLPGSSCIAGQPELPVAFMVSFTSEPFEAGDTGKVGNGFIWCGDHHGTLACQMYGDRIKFEHEGGDIRPHFMIMHGQARLEGLDIEGFGRTDKSIPLSTENPAGRYGLHFHRGGEEHQSVVKGCTISDSDGWGLVNHSSNVLAEDVDVSDVFGAGFVGEAGNEVGMFRKCSATRITSEQVPFKNRAKDDRWHAGEGFAFSGPGIELEECTASDVAVGFEWRSNGIPESIGGNEAAVQPFADGTLPVKAAAAPSKTLRVEGYRRNGVVVKWAQPRDMGDVPTLSDVIIHEGGEKSHGVEYGYLSGMHVHGLRVHHADVAIVAKDHPAAPITFQQVDIAHVRQGTRNQETSWGQFTIAGGTIEASEIGVECTAATGPRTVRLDSMDIQAPTPVAYVGDPGDNNAVYVDGVKQDWRN